MIESYTEYGLSMLQVQRLEEWLDAKERPQKSIDNTQELIGWIENDILEYELKNNIPKRFR
jgi:hypothetical protein